MCAVGQSDSLPHSPIVALPEGEIAQIQSSTYISCLTDAVLCLVKNSFDAAASKIHVSVDFSSSSCTVEDNGSGIVATEFKGDGGLFKPFCRRENLCLRENADNDLKANRDVEVAVPQLVWHHWYCPVLNSCSVHVQYSQVVAVNTPAPMWHELTLANVGTRVCVRNLFGNVPVRFKQRALINSNDRGLSEWKRLKQQIVALLIAWTATVELTLRDERSDSKLNIGNRNGSSAHKFYGSSNSIIVENVLSILTTSSFITPASWASWVPVSGSSSLVSVSGLISLEPVTNRECQFISFGIMPLSNSGEYSDVFRQINQLFIKSSFGTDQSSHPVGAGPNNKGVAYSKIQERYPLTKRPLDNNQPIGRWPMFWLHVTVLEASTEIAFLDPGFMNQDWFSEVCEAINAALTRWLEINHFQPQKRRKTIQNELSLTGNLPFYTRQPKMPISKDLEWPTNEIGKSKGQFVSWSRSKSSSLRLHKEPPCVKENLRICSTSQSTRVNHNESRANITQRPNSPASNAWITNIMNSWSNPVLKSCERGVRQIVVETLGLASGCSSTLDTAKLCPGVRSKLSKLAFQTATVVAQLDHKFILVMMNGKANFDMKKNRETSKSSPLLVVIDQHAADERVKVENLLQELFKPPSVSEGTVVSNLGHNVKVNAIHLSKPIKYRIPITSLAAFEQHAAYFSGWGILCDLNDVTGAPGQREAIQVMVSFLPPAIYERGVLYPHLIIELIQTEISKCGDLDHCCHRELSAALDSQPQDQVSKFSGNSNDWLAKFNTCPTGLVDMINSRACRSAIMFNDRLTKRDSEDLVSKLSLCTFPFQCAHGRPSVIPLVDLLSSGMERNACSMNNDGIYNVSNNFLHPKQSFACEYRRWRQILQKV